ncbi:signal peptidase I [Thermogladius sp. 4427co]|uniref:signal peptidase I n=1 Tax=Thermogladius sp. 4427co TaxID=3450718 RepID=UPI003F78CC80
MRFRDIVFAVFLVLLAASFTAIRSGFFPVAASIVSGYSMYPSLKPGDLVLAVSTSLAGFSRGDVVIYCYSWANCIIHRVIEVGEGVVVTKGDYNPAPDPPIPISLVRYRVVASIPLQIWLPALLIIVTAIFIPVHDIKRILEPLNLEALLFILIVAVYVVYTAVYVVRIPPYRTVIAVPVIQLVKYSVSRDYRVVTLTYSTENLSILGVSSCVVTAPGLGELPCDYSIVDGNSIMVWVPLGVYEKLFEQGVNMFYLNITARLDKGVLKGYYPINYTYRMPTVSIIGHTLIVSNPLPFSLKDVEVNITEVNETFIGLKHIVNASTTYIVVTIGPLENYTLSLCRPYSYAYVSVTYTYGSERQVWVAKVEGCFQQGAG